MLQQEILPIPGAAKYFANWDSEKNKYAVWMITQEPGEEKYYHVLSHHSTFEIARKRANGWQKRENKSVAKHHPEMANYPVITL